ncbi:unnamed protein product [Rotaria socialis]|uniref:Uncharacterized protein n=1 Tax=Rotaria socialis TaxID=392032 RepID=A0A818AMT0_9BILA|nr:unnamed protein product [Rotaria socialis]CAF3406340.1 unnamed protein product [Rotaria socialis]CAF3765011.1 unnamed protein product [Rotaria socialis]
MASSSSSPSPIFTRKSTDQKDAVLSPMQRKRRQHRGSTQKSFSHSSDTDDDDDDDDADDDDDEENDDAAIELLDEQTTSSALYEVNASTHRHINRHKKAKEKDYQTSQRNNNNKRDHSSQQGSIVDSRSHYQNSKFLQQTRTTTSDVQKFSEVTSQKQITQDEYDELSSIIENTDVPLSTMQRLAEENPLAPSHSQSSQSPNLDRRGVTNLVSPQNSPLSKSNMVSIQSTSSPRPLPKSCIPSPRPSETNEVLVYPSSISLKGLLSYQDVIGAIEREFHLHEGQEREIIMKLWLKEQTMMSILQRYRHLLQDLNLDDEDFLGGIKNIREMINYADRDVQYLREQAIMLENQNHFLENEFHRQLDKIVVEKNEQISRLIHIIDQTCPPPMEYTDRISDLTQSSGNQDLVAQKFMQQNVELQRQLETLRAKLEYTFALLNEKLDQNANPSTSAIIQNAIEQMRKSDTKLQELELKSLSQQEENDLLRYLMERSQYAQNVDITQMCSVLEQRSLEREITRVHYELDLTEKKLVDLEQRFENSDESVKFNIEALKLKCDVLRQHIATCNQRLSEALQQTPMDYADDTQMPSDERQYQDADQNVSRLENELLTLRERYDDLAEYSNTLKHELDNARRQLHEEYVITKDTYQPVMDLNDSSALENERQRSTELESELMSLKLKYEDVCKRVTAATLQLERVKVLLEQTLHRCEQLEKEKLEINAQSEYLSQNVASVTAKYKDKVNTIKSRLEQTDRDRREAHIRTEQLQNEIERLKNELTHKKEVIYEKDKLIQDAQYKSREILLERQTVEDRISNEYKRLHELVDKNRFLEDELERLRRSQIHENITVRRTDVINLDAGTSDSSNRLEELRTRINDFERRFAAEKACKESLQVQIKILEEENTDLRDIMNQMRKRSQDDRRTDRDRNDEIQQLIARAESNARQYMSNFNISTTSPTSTLVRIIPVSSPTKFS